MHLITSCSHGPSIVVAEVDLFDFSRGEPDTQYVTPLRVLDVCYFIPLLLMIILNLLGIGSLCSAYIDQSKTH
jgi:hypothetical protein